MPFDNEQKAELKEIFSEFGKELLKEVDKKNSGLAASVKGNVSAAIEEFKTSFKPEPKSKEGDDDKLTLKSLKGEIQTLNQQLADRDRDAQNAQRHTAVMGVAAAQKLNLPGKFARDFVAHYGADAVKSENGQWFVTSGDQVLNLESAIDKYKETDEGKLYIPVSVGGGSNSTTPKKREQSSDEKPTIDSLVAAARDAILTT